MSDHWTYSVDAENDQARIYDVNSDEISTSPVDLPAKGKQFPGDLIPAVAQEFKEEVNQTKADDDTDTAISDRALEIILILANPDRNLVSE